MGRIRYAVAGSGWRALFYVRAAQKLPEHFELTGVLCRTREKAAAFSAAHSVPAVDTLDALLAAKPDFVVSCVSKAGMADMVMQLLERGVPALSETPLAVELDTLRRLLETQRRTGTPLDMAEQYFLYPSHQARQALIARGLLGQVTYCDLSMMHDYHGISMLRAYLGEETGPVRIDAKRHVSPIVVTGGRGGYVTDGEMGEEQRVLATLDYGDGRVGLYDFAGTQYHSAIRSNHVRILGTRGEIADDEVRYLTADNRPLLGRLIVQRDGITGTIRAIDFGGERVYVNPFRADVEMTEDEIAVAAVLTRMRDHLAGGAPNTPFAFRDSYLAIAMREAAQAGACVTADALAWDAPEAAAR